MSPFVIFLRDTAGQERFRVITTTVKRSMGIVLFIVALRLVLPRRGWNSPCLRRDECRDVRSYPLLDR